MDDSRWMAALRRYVVASATLHFVWEVVQLPMFTLWRQGSLGEITIAVVHCTGGDVVIAVATLTLALVLVGHRTTPIQQRVLTVGLAMAAGIVYTVFSERSNLARGNWSYAEIMPVEPWLRVGLTPLLQWLVVPSAAFCWSIRAFR